MTPHCGQGAFLPKLPRRAGQEAVIPSQVGAGTDVSSQVWSTDTFRTADGIKLYFRQLVARANEVTIRHSPPGLVCCRPDNIRLAARLGPALRNQCYSSDETVAQAEREGCEVPQRYS